MKKWEEDKGFWKGSRTTMNRYKPSIYRVVIRKWSEKRKKRKKTYGSSIPCSKTLQYMELCPQTSINTGFLYPIPTFVHNHFPLNFCPDGSRATHYGNGCGCNPWVAVLRRKQHIKRPWKRKRIMLFFPRSIFLVE